MYAWSWSEFQAVVSHFRCLRLIKAIADVMLRAMLIGSKHLNVGNQLNV